jgi:hypothetical protein
MSKRFSVNPQSINLSQKPATTQAVAVSPEPATTQAVPVSPEPATTQAVPVSPEPATTQAVPVSPEPATTEVIYIQKRSGKGKAKYASEEEREEARRQSAFKWRQLKEAIETFATSKNITQYLYYRVNDNTAIVFVPINPQYHAWRITRVAEKLDVEKLPQHNVLPKGTRVPE